MSAIILNSSFLLSNSEAEVFVVTGGGTGIGAALAISLARRNQPVLIIGRRENLLRQTAAKASGIEYLAADVSTGEGRQLIAGYLEHVPVIKGLVHNAGTIQPIKPLNEITEVEWHHILATNVEPALFLTQLLSRKLTNQRVLNIGSGAAYFPVAGWGGYCVSKAALAMLTRCWQLESRDIDFAVAMPGIIDTDMQALIRDADFMEEDKKRFFHRLKANKQLLSAETVALFLTWLLLDVGKEQYSAKEWDIYDRSHHPAWLAAGYEVPDWEEHDD
ncbi:SDR family NAD(P)-dependent oxidoreductase [Legionella londiniensis]|uniref:SDR family NAD(P)-dependent oxidoreductase n=1 Tax=Legionella londiniensis TaxID=45068 RepID=UPI001ED9B6AF|nr:SDR family NAD(P)-dependent oxidoreductase [Legionella londiniensis]